MHLILIALLSTVTVNEVTLDMDLIESIDGQWVAPGYRVAEEIIIDPLDYGIPQLNSSDEPVRIGFQSFFVDTPDGEKWRIVIAYDREVVVLQEDEEPRRFTVERSIHLVKHSKDGSYVYVRLREEEQTQTEMILEGIAPPENRTVLININSGEQITTTGFLEASYIASDGFMVGLNSDSLRFYDNNFNQINATYNCIEQMGSTPSAYATDGSLMVRIFMASPDNTLAILRAYDKYGNVLWDSDPRNVGWPAISEHGEYVFVLGQGRLMCLDGSSGDLLWEEPLENEGRMFKTCRNGAACSFFTDATPAEVRENPDRERVLHVVNISEHNRNISRIAYSLGSIGFCPMMINEGGYSLWRAHECTFYICEFSNRGELIYAYGNTYDHYQFNNRLWRNSEPYLWSSSLNSTGMQIIWFDSNVIHIVTLEEKGYSE